MSILAEPRRKRKICLDPQNLAWKNDTNKFGHKMLQNMGWNEGQGLGLKNQGMTENIKLKANYTQKGIGAEASDADRTWIAHHDEFSFLLEKLNATKAAKVAEKEKVAESEDSGDSDEEKEAPKSKKLRGDSSKSLEEKSKATKTRIHYKYTKMKDISRYSEKDKSAVIGVGLKSKIVEQESKKEKNTAEKTFEEPATVKNSAVSVTDYFAAKMAKFYAKKNGTTELKSEIPQVKEEKVEIIEEEIVISEEVFGNEAEEKLRQKAEKKALKKAKREAEEALTENIKVEKVSEKIEEDEEEERRRRKAERKEQRRKERELQALAAEEK
uniref:G-patch domain-containing protein n=1 Tax=Panagrolaimus superbus TaxID=310955 RepID=A0A914YH66_9BILA